MPLQNRVRPDGEIVAHAARGLFMGNRGILHNDNQEMGISRWKHPHWIICLTSFKNRRRTLMAPNTYTELFFLDEAVAMAAGHRPCAECRRADYNRYQAALAQSTGEAPSKVAVLDRRLQAERVGPGRCQKTWAAHIQDIPDGAFLRLAPMQDDIRLRLGSRLLVWRMGGYEDDGARVDAHSDYEVEVLTPATNVAALRGGFQPLLHGSAHSH